MSPISEAPAPYRLDSLPMEIIRRVASHGPFTSTISLLQVNRALYHACNDWTVFQGIIANNANDSSRRPTWDLTSLIQSEKSFWARYAYADFKAAHFLHSPDDFSPSQLTTWAPLLMAMHREYSPLSLSRPEGYHHSYAFNQELGAGMA
jgi:hypothetical protein